MKPRHLAILLTLLLLGLALARLAWFLLAPCTDLPRPRTPPPAGAPEEPAAPVPADHFERELVELVERARQEGLALSVAGAGHSEVGHTSYPGGVVIDMLPHRALELDADRNLLRVQAGARWREVLEVLDREGLSVEIMQSFSDFTVGGSLSVNCHGWEPGRPPLAASVESLRVLTADGRIVTCSRNEHAELFSLVLGGYGLFGVVLEATLRVVPDRDYCAGRERLPAAELGGRMAGLMDAHGVGLAYGRVSVAPTSFLEEALVYTLVEPACDGRGAAPVRVADRVETLAAAGRTSWLRMLFRASAGSDLGKELRWRAETLLGEQLASPCRTRNAFLDKSLGTFENRSEGSLEELQEYFVPHARLTELLEALRAIATAHEAELMNATVRNLRRDEDSRLAYARGDCAALVLLFHRADTDSAAARTEAMTRELIDATLTLGGTYYLPYAPHATRAQFERAYPMAADWRAAKQRWDPLCVFRSEFHERYLRPATLPVPSGGTPAGNQGEAGRPSTAQPSRRPAAASTGVPSTGAADPVVSRGSSDELTSSRMRSRRSSSSRHAPSR